MLLCKKIWLPLLCFIFCASFVWADEKNDQETIDLGSVQVSAEGEKKEIIFEMDRDILNIDDIQTPSVPQNIVDLIKNQPMIDFKGGSDLVPDDDTISMRGFSGKRFVTALDGLTIRKTGGRKSSHIVDYALLPPWMIGEIEILPGPHSALYPSKAIGGVINLKTRRHKRYETTRPDFHGLASYRSYNTQNDYLVMHGGVEGAIYDLGVQKYITDGYLRNNAADITTVYGRGGYVFSDGGYLTLSSTYTDADRQTPVNNDPNSSSSDYDSSYPTLSCSAFDPWQDPTWDKIATSYRVDFEKPTDFGLWTAAAGYGEENRDYSYLEWVDAKDHGKGTRDGSWETKWKQWTAKIQDEIAFNESNVSTLGLEGTQLYDGYGRTATWEAPYDNKKRMENYGLYAQHKWSILPSLSLTAGLRYEVVRIWVGNESSSTGQTYITGLPAWIEREWDHITPKTFLTWDMDSLHPGLRDTSLAMGLSGIWRAPDYHGDYNGAGRPSGVWLEPEHGEGLDLVFKRRLFKDIELKIDYSFYRIRDYIASNSQFAKYTPSKDNQVEPGQEYKDYKINLDEVWRQGVEAAVKGHIFKNLSFYVGYAFQDFQSRGDEPAGKTEMDNRPRHKVSAGLDFALLPQTHILVDYNWRDDEVIEIANEISPDEWEFHQKKIKAHHVVDLAVEQVLFDKGEYLKKAKLSFFATNLLNATYENEDGYPATDRTFGVALSCDF